ncbi:hypothetical protein [Paenibacillus monticola]|uniref:Uncharacterized protein n=1 Tax=Paenibacillus monticola TaxID=2666075 RepID=A0A7X2H400_9BACL|nr:hypothetical protein [Paenibacillus monticola]MRN53127.1 hypothetical protein [Paenibacillus monticola]
MSKRRPHKLNTQAILDITEMNLVWPELEAQDSLHFYHLTDALGRKWQTIGCHVTDAIKVFEMGEYPPWTSIIEAAPYNQNVTIRELIPMLNCKDNALKNDMQIILNTSVRCNQFISKIINVNYYSIFQVLYDLKNKYLLNDPISISDFEYLYSINPIESLSRFYLENVDTLDYWEWVQAGGSAELAINFRNANPNLTLIEAIEKAERLKEQ